MMGSFVIGILVGWIAEWLFFTFWIKGRSTGEFADCTALKNELATKNKEISTLKAELESGKKAAISTATAAKATTAVKSETNVTSGTKNSKATTKKKATAKAAPAKKSPAKKATTTKAAPKKAPAKKDATKTTAAKKAPAKKDATKAATAKKTPAVKKDTTKATAKKSIAKKTTSGDDLTRLSGIGPSMAATLSELGITSFKKLAAMDDDILRDMLEASGARLNNNKEAMDTWNEQATLADNGDLEGLQKLQDSLKK